MSTSTISGFLSADHLISLDCERIASYNLKRKEPYYIHSELGPSAYEGDIDSAPLVLLLANPGFDETSTLQDHRFQVSGWHLSGLHPDAPAGLQSWWHTRLKVLIHEFGARRVANAVACLQITPWASNRFDDSLCLPSRPLILQAANRCAERGAIMLVMRAERHWLNADAVRSSQRRFRVNSWRCSYVSPGNLPINVWQEITRALSDA